ncbi:MAG: TRAP transporter small permease [Halomonas meridiana]|uniref:TRAP transporter small permease n=1 Tax=Halomonadaceae TaxID=28256 RepID=UPI000481C5A2|nr:MULTISPECIES: TRAP transporter small permease subunit [Halomonas]MAO49531.1 hypothetical protein [Pusillimonas sp.]MCE7520723.1 TRAP transporter small permease [Halomonas titanicae]MDK2751948.1 TRAP transporter small permease [Halomonas meridiana]|tara:strand:- start:218 stop:694 length:477 start_codon:yes stop_codon:yes gene_type:complete
MSKNSVITKVLEALIVLCSICIVGLMVLLVASRYVGVSLMGILEIVMVFAIWLYMLGAILASKNNTHLEVDLLALSLKGTKALAYHKIYVSLVTVAVTSLFSYLAYKMIMWGINLPQSTPALSIPLTLPSSAILVAALACLAFALRDLYFSIISRTRS